jgi:acetyl-CoA acetyltransferase
MRLFHETVALPLGYQSRSADVIVAGGMENMSLAPFYLQSQSATVWKPY